MKNLNQTSNALPRSVWRRLTFLNAALTPALFLVSALTSVVATPTLAAPPPTIFVQPATFEYLAGASGQFRVTASDAFPLTYQWWHDGVLLPNEINSYLVLPHLQPSDLGAYWVVVTNPFGTIQSDVAEILPGRLAEATETEGLIWHGYEGDVGWSFVTDQSHDGVDSAAAFVRPLSRNASMGVTVEGPGILTFWWRHLGTAIRFGTGLGALYPPSKRRIP